jgi:tetratricopeptide (TPR) repeat protein
MTRLGWVRRISLLLPALGLALMGPVAQARDPGVEEAKAYFRAGAQAYAVGEYAAAVQAFEQAHALAPRPAVLFSIAQAERRLFFLNRQREHLLKAIQMYRRYLEAEPQAARKVDAVQALSELEPLVAPSPSPSEPSTRPADIARILPTRVMISSPAPGALISLDGQAAIASPLIREVEPGQHRVRVSAPGFVDSERTLVAVKGAFVTVDVGLAERPAKLVVQAPDGAQLSVDGRVQGDCPFPRPLELSAGSHLITLTKRGFVGVTKEEVLVRGRTTTLRASMPRSAQRTTALIMLGTAASALAGGGVFAYFALSQESTAESFLDRRGHAPLTTEELAEYNTAREDRDRLRTAALASVGIGAGLGVTGVLLFSLDRRLFDQPRGTEPLTGKGRVGHEAGSVAVRPLLGPGFTGVGVSGGL